MEITELCKLAEKYGTDKCPQLGHEYTPFYYELLKDKKETIKKVLEVGIGCDETMQYLIPKKYQVGASLRMWRDFFPNAMIYGTDIRPEALFEDERIRTFLSDSAKWWHVEKLLEETGSDIDLFIDDGNHYTNYQLRTFNNFMPRLKKDVIYIIEDVARPYEIKERLKDYDCEVKIFTRKGKKDTLLLIRNR